MVSGDDQPNAGLVVSGEDRLNSGQVVSGDAGESWLTGQLQYRSGTCATRINQVFNKMSVWVCV